MLREGSRYQKSKVLKGMWRNVERLAVKGGCAWVVSPVAASRPRRVRFEQFHELFARLFGN